MRVLHAEPALEKCRQAARHAEIRVDATRIAPFVPTRQPHDRMPLPHPQPQQAVAEVVPIDHEAHATMPQQQPRDEHRRKRGRILDEDELGPLQLSQRAPEPEADARGVEEAGDCVARTAEIAAHRQSRRVDAVNRDPRVGRDRLRQRHPLETDEVDVDAIRRERLRVIAHAGASAQISENDDGSSHSGMAARGRAAILAAMGVVPETDEQIGRDAPPVVSRGPDVVDRRDLCLERSLRVFNGRPAR